MLTWRHTHALRAAFSAGTLLQGFFPNPKACCGCISPPRQHMPFTGVQYHSIIFPLQSIILNCCGEQPFKQIQSCLVIFVVTGWKLQATEIDNPPTTTTTSISNSILWPDRHLFGGSGFYRLGSVFLTPRFSWTHIKGLLHNGNCWWPKWLLYQMDCQVREATTHASVRHSQSN